MWNGKEEKLLWVGNWQKEIKKQEKKKRMNMWGLAQLRNELTESQKQLARKEVIITSTSVGGDNRSPAAV